MTRANRVPMPLNRAGDYCNKDLDKLFDEQSVMTDQDKRKKLVWEIDRKLQEDGARPIIFHNIGATCMQPQVKEPDDDGQQHLQRLALRGRLGRQVARGRAIAATEETG